MARIHELLAQLRTSAPALAADIEREVDVLADRRAFGLNFERHTPEAVELPGRKVRVGDKVRVQPPRGEMPTVANRALYRVATIERNGGRRVAKIAALGAEFEGAEAGDASHAVNVDDLVVVAEFRDPIYPGLVSTGKVERGGDKPYHAVVNAENFHALQTLLFTHRGAVDAIYIDPPYNTGAKDWKYNNDYVESDDMYRHSKWLAFMERRLLLAKELLNPDDSVLVVTIDEKEYLHLGLLLEQVLPEATIQMVSIVINPSGTSRDYLSRVDEYAYFCFFGAARPFDSEDDLLSDLTADGAKVGTAGVRWEWLLRGGGGWYRDTRPNLCYPVLVSDDRTTMIGAGEPLAGDEKDRPAEIDGHAAVWPVRSDGKLGIWRVDSRKLNELIAKGYAHVSSKPNAEQPTLRYLLSGTVEQIEVGALTVTGRGKRGEVLVEFPEAARVRRVKTVWSRGRHIAGGAGGAHLLNLLFNDRGRFTYPKSLYAVEDTVRIAVGGKPHATVVDFFSGSGTTTHAVMRLNKQDGGQRVSISVTNNEVSADEQAGLRKAGLRPGDPAWEQLGICDYITKPRIAAAVTGETAEGSPVKGNYAFTDIFPIADGFEENVEFFTLTYEAPMRVQSNREFARIAPFLWLRAGSRGRRIESLADGWDVADAYGVLADLDQTDAFLEALAPRVGANVAFIVTDEDRLFQAVVRDLPPNVEPVRMYESYLRNFEIDAMRSVR